MSRRDELLRQWVLDADASQDGPRDACGGPDPRCNKEEWSERSAVARFWGSLAREAGTLRLDQAVDAEALRRLRRPGSEGGLVTPLLHLAAVLAIMVGLVRGMESEHILGRLRTGDGDGPRVVRELQAGQVVQAGPAAEAGVATDEVQLLGGGGLLLHRGAVEFLGADRWQAGSDVSFEARLGVRITTVTLGAHEVRGREARFRVDGTPGGHLHLRVEEGTVRLEGASGRTLRAGDRWNLPAPTDATVVPGMVVPGMVRPGAGGGTGDGESPPQVQRYQTPPPAVVPSQQSMPGQGEAPLAPQAQGGGLDRSMDVATASLRGRVVAKASYAPIADVLVRLIGLPDTRPGDDDPGKWRERSEAEREAEGLWYRAWTDREGRFQFAEVPKGRYRAVALVPARSGLADGLLEEVVLEEGAPVELLMELGPGFTLDARFVDGRGLPLDDVLATGATRAATSDASGWCRLEGVPWEGATLRLEADGLPLQWIEVGPGTNGDTWTLAEAPPWRLPGGMAEGDRRFTLVLRQGARHESWSIDPDQGGWIADSRPPAVEAALLIEQNGSSIAVLPEQDVDGGVDGGAGTEDPVPPLEGRR